MPPLLRDSRSVAFTNKIFEKGERKMSTGGKYGILGANDLAERMLDETDLDVLLVDCRSLLAFNCRHIKGAIHINCTGIGRKRISQGKAKLKDLISSSDGKEKFLSGEISTVIVYDEFTSDVPDCAPGRPIVFVLQTLAKEGKDIFVLKGGLKEFCKKYENLCESAVPRICTQPKSVEEDYPPTPTIESNDLYPRGPSLTSILPFLYLGNQEGAADENLIDRLSIKYVLNVTPFCPNYFIQKAGMHYKQIKICDSNQADIGQYFDEAFKFIDEANERGCCVLVHCHAGVSRSATVTVAYVMKHTGMSLHEAYKFVKEKRPVISPNLNFMGHLLKYEKNRKNGQV